MKINAKLYGALACLLCTSVFASPISLAAESELGNTNEISAGSELISVHDPESLEGELYEGSKSDATVLFTENVTSDGGVSLMSYEITPSLLKSFQEQTTSFEYSDIDVTKFKIPVSDIDDVYSTLILSSPKSYYLMKDNGTYFYSYASDKKGEYVTYIYPEYQIDIISDEDGYSIDPAKLNAVMPEIEETWQMIDNEVEQVFWYVSASMTDAEKLIQFHNYINFNFKYAYDEYSKPQEERTGNSLVYLLKNRTGMCQAYAMFMNYLAMQSGLKTAFVTSYDQNGTPYHMWNLVEARSYTADMEPYWYHLDSTWDDTLNDGFGVTNMKYFLLSDAAMRVSHDNIVVGNSTITYGDIEVETGTCFDNELWHDSASPLVPFAYKWYFIKHLSGDNEPSTLYEYDPTKTDSSRYTELFSYKERWYADPDGNTAFDNTYTGLGCINGWLCFNGPKTLYAYNLHTGKLSEKTPIETQQGYAVYSCYISGTSLHYGVAKSGPDAYKNIVEGGEIKLTDFAISESRVTDGILHIRFATDSSGEDPHNINFLIRDGGSYKVWNGTIINKQHVQIPVNNPNDLELFFWDDNMKPYTTYYYLNGNYHDYN